MHERCGEMQELWESIDLMLLLRHGRVASLYIESYGGHGFQ